jgi:hypothetical protein
MMVRDSADSSTPHKCCGSLSEFSTVAGGLAGSPEGLAAGAQLDKAVLILEQLETTAQELLHRLTACPSRRPGRR